MNPEMPKTLWIKDGPGRWDLMLSIFDGKEVAITIGSATVHVVFRGGYFDPPSIGYHISNIFNFNVMVPTFPGASDKISVRGVLDVKNRRGKIENPQYVNTTGERANLDDLLCF
jgi:hypothetical protein